jgi:hypothetical protein
MINIILSYQNMLSVKFNILTRFSVQFSGIKYI